MTEQILAFQKMQDYIEVHLSEVITLAALAEYIRRMRLAKSSLLLKNNIAKSLMVAFDLRFTSFDGYTRAFYQKFGINPEEYAKNPVPLKLFVAYSVKFKEFRKGFRFINKC